MSSMSLNDLTDVTISNPTIDQKIAYNGTQWVNYYAKVLLTYDTFFQGKTITISKGGSSSTATLPLNETEAILLVPSKGEYGITYTESGHTYSASVDVVDSGEIYYATLYSKDTINVTLYSAVGDTVSYIDADNVEKTAVFESDSSSKVVTLSIIPSGISITFNSSIARDIDGVMSSDTYSKTITVNSSTTEVYVMPEGTLYWWGYITNDIESCIPANGWSLDGVISSISLEAPEYLTNSIKCKYATTQDKWHGIGTKNAMSNKSNIIFVTFGEAGNTNGVYVKTDKRIGWSTPTNILASASVKLRVLQRINLDVSEFSNYYLNAYSQSSSGFYVYAIVAQD